MENTKLIDEMKKISETLREASKAYYSMDNEIMSNLEYDALYDRLVELEKITGVVLAGSPTVTVGYEAVDSLPKERHASSMLSLDKTKERQDLASFLGGYEGLLSWKLDGLTIVLTYTGGMLSKAVTRGNGEIGEVITGNALTFLNLPHKIPYEGELVLRGEAVISYSDFEEINEALPEGEPRYKNPRNLCSGSVRQLDNHITASRRVRFFAFSFVSGPDFTKRSEQMEFLKSLGFECVEYFKVNSQNVVQTVGQFEDRISEYEIPSDGLVLTLDDIEYAKSLGTTAKFPRDSIAFKWADELAETVLLDVEWSPSRIGLINPVAIFEPVELEGTTVSRASLHNISIIEGLKLGIGDHITVYKANMIIPQVGSNLTQSGGLPIPDVCPVCGEKTTVRAEVQAKSLYCTNPDCQAKRIGTYTQFVSRNAMNIDGLSEATLEKFIEKGYIHEFADLYHLDRYRDEIVGMEGFGEKSYENLINAVNNSRTTELHRVLFGIGIPNIGVANAKLICKYFGGDVDKIIDADSQVLSEIDGVGEVIGQGFVQYFSNEKRRAEVLNLLQELFINFVAEDEAEQTLKGMNFVITGSLNIYENRDAMKEAIEKKGGKVTGSVTQKTRALINNDVASQSSKNKKAKELGVLIISEADFIDQYLK